MSRNGAPRISVCVPTFNSAETVQRCLDSIARQTFRDFEVVVSDDASRDGTVELARAYEGITVRVLQNDRNLGLVGNHNRCIEAARGELIQFVHADDYLLPRALETMSSAFDVQSVALAVARRDIETDDPQWLNSYRELQVSSLGQGVHDGEDLARRYMRSGRGQNWIGEPTAVMFRRSDALRVGGFDERLAQLLDMDLWLRLIAGSKFQFYSDSLSVRVQHQGTATVRNRADRRDWLDAAWMYAGILTNTRCSRAIRVEAMLWWSLEIVRQTLRVICRERGRRVPRFRSLFSHIRETFGGLSTARKYGSE